LLFVDEADPDPVKEDWMGAGIADPEAHIAPIE
jgi:hypothetical protein